VFRLGCKGWGLGHGRLEMSENEMPRDEKSHTSTVRIFSLSHLPLSALIMSFALLRDPLRMCVLLC
jgi:hypothetical protein